MKKKNNLTLMGAKGNRRTFEHKEISANHYARALEECYKTASDYKIRVYDYWQEFLSEALDELYIYGVDTYNTNIITLYAEGVKDGAEYRFRITPSYNYYCVVR